VHFSSLSIILPIARCLPNWGFVPQFKHNLYSLWILGKHSKGLWKIGEEGFFEETNL
jgi:hypothetical protein